MIRARWYEHDDNWGDKINPTLIESISGQKVLFSKKKGHKKYIVVGSIIHYADDNTIVWGAGMISNKHLPVGKPGIRSVRGPLTRKFLISNGFSCPEVYGDPVLVYPNYYDPQIKKTNRIGIVPHYKDKNLSWVKKQNIKLIDIQGNINKVVDDVCSCEIIISSSLHGIILADAYGIPGYWIKLSDNLVGGDFKFVDYMLSVGRRIDPIIITDNTKISEIEKKFYDYKIDIDLDLLMNKCPFKKRQ